MSDDDDYELEGPPDDLEELEAWWGAAIVDDDELAKVRFERIQEEIDSW